MKYLLALPSCLPQHIHHPCLEDGVHGLDTDTSSALWHGEDIDYPHCVIVDELAEHKAHDFHGDAGAAVPKHLEEGEGGDVDGFGVVD